VKSRTFMRRWAVSVVAGVTLIASVPSAHAAQADATGYVVMITQLSAAAGYTAETVEFRLDNQPSVAGCTPWTTTFSISPNTIPDAQTRKNMLALLLTAKTQGTAVEVRYDNAGSFCDGGAIGVYYIEVLG
jgi:hypothetical protein